MRQAIEAFKRADTDENGLVGVQGVLAALLPPSNTVTDAEQLIAEFGEEGANVLDRPRFIRMQKALWAREDEAEEQRAAAAAADAIRNEDSFAPGGASDAAPSAATAARIGAMQAEIDELNILRATLLSMARAVAALPTAPTLALVDGNRPPALACEVRCIVKGDATEPAISAASIVAKVTRDRIMHDLALRHPGYGWERNAAYGTAEHRAALRALGATEHHRTSFAPVREVSGHAISR